MSIGRISYINEGLLGVIGTYIYFPEELQSEIIQGHARLYNEIYSRLTPEQKTTINSNTPNIQMDNSELNSIHAHEISLVKTLNTLNTDYYSEKGVRDRGNFFGISEDFVQHMLDEYNKDRGRLTQKLTDLKAQRNHIIQTRQKKIQESALFD